MRGTSVKHNREGLRGCFYGDVAIILNLEGEVGGGGGMMRGGGRSD